MDGSGAGRLKVIRAVAHWPLVALLRAAPHEVSSADRLELVCGTHEDRLTLLGSATVPAVDSAADSRVDARLEFRQADGTVSVLGEGPHLIRWMRSGIQGPLREFYIQASQAAECTGEESTGYRRWRVHLDRTCAEKVQLEDVLAYMAQERRRMRSVLASKVNESALDDANATALLHSLEQSIRLSAVGSASNLASSHAETLTGVTSTPTTGDAAAPATAQRRCFVTSFPLNSVSAVSSRCIDQLKRSLKRAAWVAELLDAKCMLATAERDQSRSAYALSRNRLSLAKAQVRLLHVRRSYRLLCAAVSSASRDHSASCCSECGYWLPLSMSDHEIARHYALHEDTGASSVVGSLQMHESAPQDVDTAERQCPICFGTFRLPFYEFELHASECRGT